MKLFITSLCLYFLLSPLPGVYSISKLNPDKLHVQFQDGISREGPLYPRKYTLTHSDATGDLYLTIGPDYNFSQISGLYTRIMRDEVLAEWRINGEKSSLHIYCHVSGGIVFGPAGWRDSIFRRHLPMVIQSIYYGDRLFLETNSGLTQSKVFVHFKSSRDKYNRLEDWGNLEEYQY